jgi:hypothetical protein
MKPDRTAQHPPRGAAADGTAARLAFVIAPVGDRWVARNRSRHIERVFDDRRAAIRFALFEAGSCAAIVVPKGAA